MCSDFYLIKLIGLSVKTWHQSVMCSKNCDKNNIAFFPVSLLTLSLISFHSLVSNFEGTKQSRENIFFQKVLLSDKGVEPFSYVIVYKMLLLSFHVKYL